MFALARAPLAALLMVALLVGACSSSPDRITRRDDRRRPLPGVSPTQAADNADNRDVGPTILASSFEQPVCGTFYQPGRGCEFGIQNEVESTTTDCRTGDTCLRFERFLESRSEHIHVGGVFPLPNAHGFVGAAHRVPDLSFSPEGFIQLMQVTPGDGTVDASVVEVRYYEDGRLGLASYRGSNVELARRPVPLDEWFYVVVEVTYGPSARQRMWIYDPEDELVETVAIDLDTTGDFCCRSRQAIGGTVSAGAPGYTYADDFYIATENLGPLHIGPDGVPLS
jgi:hypothetical protein